MEEVYYRQCAVPLEHCIERIVFSTPLFPSCEEGILNPLPSPRPFQKGKGCNCSSCRSEPLRSKVGIFSKINPSFFTIKEGSTSHLGLLPSGKKRKPLLPVALNRFAIRLAGHQSPRQFFCAGRDRREKTC